MLGKRNARTAVKPKKWQQEITSDDINILESDPSLNQDDDDDSEFRKRRKLEEDRQQCNTSNHTIFSIELINEELRETVMMKTE